MASYRIATLLPEESQTAAGTKTIDLNITDVISRIEIKLDRLAASNTFAGHPSADVTKIELVDGSDVLFSMTGAECQALNIYDRQCPTMVEGTFINANDIISRYGLDFGRWLWDPLLALDPNKFRNLQLKISHTLVNCNASCVSGTVEVRAWVFDEKKVTPSGFLMSKELYSYTCGAANSYEYIELPTDYPIRKLLIRGYYAGTQPADSVTEFRIDENMEQKIPIDMGTETYYSFMVGTRWKPVVESLQAYTAGSNNYFYITPTWYWSMTALAPGDENHVWMGYAPAGGKCNIKGAASTSFSAVVTGYLPNHCIEVPFGDSSDVSDWYNVTSKSMVRLRLKAGGNGTNGTAQVVLQQLRRY